MGGICKSVHLGAVFVVLSYGSNPNNVMEGVMAQDENAPASQNAGSEVSAYGNATTEALAPQEIDPEALEALQKLEERRKAQRRKRIIKILIIVGIVVLLLVGMVASCTVAGLAALKQATAPQTAVVTRETLEASVQATGEIKPGTEVAVTPEVSGIIQDVMVTEGQHVEAGDVLFTLRNAELERSLSDAQAALDKARRGVSDAQNSVSSAWDSYNSAVDSYNDQVDRANAALDEADDKAKAAYDKTYDKAIAAIPKTATKEERKKLEADAEDAAQAAYDAVIAEANAQVPGAFDDSVYRASVDAAESTVDAANDAVADAQRAYDYAAEEAAKRTVRASVAGTVLDLQATPGAAVGGATGGTSTAKSGALAKIDDLSALAVNVEVNEVDVSSVVVGQSAELTFPAIPDLQLPGRVSSVASVSSSSSGESATTGGGGGGVVTFKVSVVIDTPDERLKPGMTASVKILTKSIPNALVVPSAAVTEEGGVSTVHVVTDEKTMATEEREVTVADRTTREFAIADGLEEGETVLIDSGTNLGSSSSSSGSK